MRLTFQGPAQDAALPGLKFAPHITRQAAAPWREMLHRADRAAKLTLEFPRPPEYAENTVNAQNNLGDDPKRNPTLVTA
jgi:hypothetical protein